MMKKFGRVLEEVGVEYLLISGQAAVLHGASVFSEDVDIWVNPTPPNWRRFIRALTTLNARVHKLTPPLDLNLLRRGHGFHFRLPSQDKVPLFLDVMGRPPRVEGFGVCRARASSFDTEWGRLPVVSIPDLVRLKKTRRLVDYETISRLVERRLAESAHAASPARSLLSWALRSSFSADDLLNLMTRCPGALQVAARLRREALKLLCPAARDPRHVAQALQVGSEAMLREIARHQEKDRRYWQPILRDLRRFRHAERLLPEGSPVGRA